MTQIATNVFETEKNKKNSKNNYKANVASTVEIYKTTTVDTKKSNPDR